MTNTVIDYLRWCVVAALSLSPHVIGARIVAIYHPPSVLLRHLLHSMSLEPALWLFTTLLVFFLDMCFIRLPRSKQIKLECQKDRHF
jgi:hypothetical protein